MLDIEHYCAIFVAYLASIAIGCWIKSQVSWTAVRYGFFAVGIIITIFAGAVLTVDQSTSIVGWFLLGVSCLFMGWLVLPGLQTLIDDLRYQESEDSSPD